MTRSRAVERREQRETEKRTQQRRWIIIGIVVGIILLGILVFLVRQPADAPLVAESAARYADLEQSRTEDGFARLGDPAAPVNVSIYTSFASTNAAAFHNTAIDRLVERVRSGAIQLIYIPMSLGNTDGSVVANGVGAARTALCSIEQSRFWQLTDTFFSWQSQFGNQAFTNNRIIAVLDALQINQGDYNTCLGSARPGDALNASETDAEGLQTFAGMPTVTINGAVPLDTENIAITDIDTLIARIDAAITDAQRAPEATPEATSEAEATADATAEAPTDAATELPAATATALPTAEPTLAPTRAATSTPGS